MTTEVKDPGKYEVSKGFRTTYWVFMFLGILTFIVALIKNPERGWVAFLVPFFFFTSIALGGLFFTAIQHVTKAGWSVNVRRFCEAQTSFLPFAFLAALLILFFGGNYLYEWFHPHEVARDHLLAHKAPYLNKTFFAIRLVLFFGVWWIFQKVIVGWSLAQDESGDESITQKLVGVSVGFVLFFALSYSFFSVDSLMSLEPHWFSTIFGVYCFAGLFQSTIATMILTIYFLKKKHLLSGFVNENHYHDLGKFLFAFTVFWAYIAFSQFMLIWYANLPEETFWYIPRVQGGWTAVSLSLLFFKFIVPFLALLPRWAKRTPTYLAAVSIWILVMQYVDIYWMAYPAFFREAPVFSFYELFIFLGFFGLFLFSISRFLSRNNLVPIKDPRIEESLHHHVVY
ncbi:MAG: molybdopterin oxidoreductase [Bdellovibrio sp.]|nr:MAG: molybdopterin oxidoreductase [Bdellovibrio sp.]